MSAAASLIDGEIDYRPRGRVAGNRIGAHRSRAVGSLGTFRDQVPFMSYPDARRIDVRATLRDPFGNTFVRRFHQRAAIDVWMLVDVSGSLDYEGTTHKKDLIVALGTALARSVTRLGDRFGLYACGATIRDECTIPPTKRPGIVSDVARRLEAVTYAGRSADGLLDAADRLAGSRKMVLVVSDYLLPLPFLYGLFERLATHDVVPVVIADSTEDRALPNWGLVDFVDLETGGRRLVFMRPSLKSLWLAKLADRRSEIRRLTRQFGRSPITITDKFDVDSFSHQLQDS